MAVTYVRRKFSLSSDTFVLQSSHFFTLPSCPHPHPHPPLCSPMALETEWSECELTIVEINGIWSTGYKEWQSLDSKWAKRVVRTWAVLVVRKGWREREMERWRKGRRPLAVCSRTKCWIMRSDWHDPAPELRETALPLHLSLFLHLSISFSLAYTYFLFCLFLSLFYLTLLFLHKLQLHWQWYVMSKADETTV